MSIAEILMRRDGNTRQEAEERGQYCRQRLYEEAVDAGDYKATCTAFDIPEMFCVSITETRSRIREQMKSFSFPIWVVKYVLDGNTFKTSKDVVSRLIDNYCGIANNKNMDGEKSDNDIALTIPYERSGKVKALPSFCTGAIFRSYHLRESAYKA